ncbi:MAG: DUF3800 domain-containing protein [Gammaproteobacteria bacterium]|nr:DUF3800 domain-containing protein [Gammaproteobacteria bacterium]
MADYAYIFLDESGNFDFSQNGSRYFVLTGVSLRRPFPILQALDAYKHDLLEAGRNIEYFHCAHDRKDVRSQVFDVITAYIDHLRLDCLVTEKSTVETKLRRDARFYPRMLGYLLKKILHAELVYGTQEFIVITDSIPLHNKRHTIAKVVKSTLTDMLPRTMKYRIMHHSSRSHYGLQVADYCCWAIFRKWERNDDAYYSRVRQAFGSENWILRRTTRHASGKK